MGTIRNMYYVPGSLVNLAEMKSRAIFLSSGPNTDEITIHHHAHGLPCDDNFHDIYMQTLKKDKESK